MQQLDDPHLKCLDVNFRRFKRFCFQINRRLYLLLKHLMLTDANWRSQRWKTASEASEASLSSWWNPAVRWFMKLPKEQVTWPVLLPVGHLQPARLAKKLMLAVPLASKDSWLTLIHENVVFYKFFNIQSAVFTGTSQMGGVSRLDKLLNTTRILTSCFYRMSWHLLLHCVTVYSTCAYFH